jgi:hypothetical protein
LHVVPGIWRELLNFSSGAVCLVLASEIFIESDCIREYYNFNNTPAILNYEINNAVLVKTWMIS